MPTANALARRAVACKAWHWLPGMRAVGGRPGYPDAWFRLEDSPLRLMGEWAAALPDLLDPATLGCLLALVREAWRDPLLFVSFGAMGWEMNLILPDTRLSISQRRGYVHADTEAGALVKALEVAP